jgi:hypothetical protein
MTEQIYRDAVCNQQANAEILPKLINPNQTGIFRRFHFTAPIVLLIFLVTSNHGHGHPTNTKAIKQPVETRVALFDIKTSCNHCHSQLQFLFQISQ